MTDLHYVHLDIATEFDRVCKKHSIKYFLAYGSLLGAIRHKGPIPWDDDFDVAMSRSDYDKFLQIVKVELKEQYFVDCREFNQDYHLTYSKLYKKNTFYEENENVGINSTKCIFIDIFPLDPVEKIYSIKFKLYFRVIRLLSLAMIESSINVQSNFTVFKKNILRLVIILVGTGKLYPLFKAIIKRLKGKENQYIMNFCADLDTRHAIPTFTIKSFQKSSFMNSEFFIPKYAETILTRLYGDFYELPPVEDRKPSHSVRYKVNNS
jgi:phosphorylcholine metabolism protein LicD